MAAPLTSIRRPASLGALALWLGLAAPASAPGAELGRATFTAPADGEAFVTVAARCPDCDWGVKGGEAAILRVRKDDGPWRDIVLTRTTSADYQVALGPVARGFHSVVVTHDRRASAPRSGRPVVEAVRPGSLAPGQPGYDALAHAPWIEPLPEALSGWSDVPLLMWVETDALDDGARRLRYSAVFSGADADGPADRRLATRGRLAGIELLYTVELDAGGRVLREDLPGRGQGAEPFRGKKEGRHPILSALPGGQVRPGRGAAPRVVTPQPLHLSLEDVSREAVMDAHPWTYAVAAQEARREGRLAAEARPGSGLVRDVRQYVYLDACADAPHASFTFAVATGAGGGEPRWHESDGALPGFRMASVLANGCFRGAALLPEGTRDEDIKRLRLRAFPAVAPHSGTAPAGGGPAAVRLRRVNGLFRLDAQSRPAANLFAWAGDLPLVVDGPPAEFLLPSRRGGPERHDR